MKLRVEGKGATRYSTTQYNHYCALLSRLKDRISCVVQFRKTYQDMIAVWSDIQNQPRYKRLKSGYYHGLLRGYYQANWDRLQLHMVWMHVEKGELVVAGSVQHDYQALDVSLSRHCWPGHPEDSWDAKWRTAHERT